MTMKCFLCGKEEVCGLINSDSVAYPNFQVFACRKCIVDEGQGELIIKSNDKEWKSENEII